MVTRGKSGGGREASRQQVARVKPITQSGPDDCVRACIASVLDLELHDLRPIAPDRWWSDADAALRDYGLGLVEGSPAYFKQSHLWDVEWLALVPSLHWPGSHAIVMRGKEVLHDPARSEPRYTTEQAWAAGTSMCGALIVIRHAHRMVELRAGARSRGEAA